MKKTLALVLTVIMLLSIASFAAAVSAMHTSGVLSGDFRITTAALVYSVLTLGLYVGGAWRAVRGVGFSWPLVLILTLPAILALILCEMHKMIKSLEKNG